MFSPSGKTLMYDSVDTKHLHHVWVSVPGNVKVSIPHDHQNFDETIYGLVGLFQLQLLAERVY